VVAHANSIARDRLRQPIPELASKYPPFV
jgi:hypothetical protein